MKVNTVNRDEDMREVLHILKAYRGNRLSAEAAAFEIVRMFRGDIPEKAAFPECPACTRGEYPHRNCVLR
jgi:hypothetical protein